MLAARCSALPSAEYVKHARDRGGGQRQAQSFEKRPQAAKERVAVIGDGGTRRVPRLPLRRGARREPTRHEVNEYQPLAVRGGQRGGGRRREKHVERAKLAAGDRKREGTQAIGGDDMRRDAAAQQHAQHVELAIADSFKEALSGNPLIERRGHVRGRKRAARAATAAELLMVMLSLALMLAPHLFLSLALE